MALLNYSKTLTRGANEDVQDVQDLLDEARAQINNIQNANVAADANLDGAKLLNASVASAKLASGIDGAKLLAASVPASALVSGIFDLVYYHDTQSASVGASGALTGISVTPAAGTYLALALARVQATVTSDNGNVTSSLTIRKDGASAITGPVSGIPNGDTGEAGSWRVDTPAYCLGILSCTGTNVVDILATITETNGSVVVDDGVLALLQVL